MGDVKTVSYAIVELITVPLFYWDTCFEKYTGK